MCLDNEELPDDGIMLVETKSWQLYFDGVVRNRGAGVGIMLVTPSGGLVLIHSLYSRYIQITCLNKSR